MNFLVPMNTFISEIIRAMATKFTDNIYLTIVYKQILFKKQAMPLKEIELLLKVLKGLEEC